MPTRSSSIVAGMSVEVLVLDDRPEALGTRVVVARIGRAHRAADPERGAQLLGLAVAELTAVVGLKDRIGDVPEARRDDLVQRVGHDLGAHVIC